MKQSRFTEAQSKQIWTSHLANCGFTDIVDTDTFDKHCYYDIKAKYKGVEYRFELKTRSVSSNRYGDNTCEPSKIQKFRESGCKKCFLVSFFTDCVKISDVFSTDYYEEVVSCPRTTCWGGGRVDKKLIHFRSFLKTIDYQDLNLKDIDI